MQSYEINAQETWKTNSKYAKVNRRILQNIRRIATVLEQHSPGRGSPVPCTDLSGVIRAFGLTGDNKH